MDYIACMMIMSGGVGSIYMVVKSIKGVRK